MDGGPDGYQLIGPISKKSKKKDMDKEITAEWARKTADTVLSKKVEAELVECEENIKQAVSENKMTTTIYSFYGHIKTVQELESRGFKIKQYDDQRDGSSLTISW